MTIPSSLVAMRPLPSSDASMHIVSIKQAVPNRKADDFNLTRLTTDFPEGVGIFREIEEESNNHTYYDMRPRTMSDRDHRLDKNTAGNVLLNSFFTDAASGDHHIAPELRNIKHYACHYRTTGGSASEIFTHNASVAAEVGAKKISKMWSILSVLSYGQGLSGSSGDALDPLFTPTISSLLKERGDFGDVQTCVTICEIVDIFEGQTATGAGSGDSKELLASSTSQPLSSTGLDIDLELVREWYLSYVEILQRLRLFEACTVLLSGCKDSVVSAVNQQSTQIYESCSACNKPLRGVFDTAFRYSANPGGVSTSSSNQRKRRTVLTAQRACNSCRKKIGMCVICHQPVKSLFSWCPGCSHGGHSACLRAWFEKNDVCPSGCGHKCNFGGKKEGPSDGFS